MRVHLIDARTGKPIFKKPVRLWRLESSNQFRPGHLEEKTDTSGVASFNISEPLPQYFQFHIGMGGYWDECTYGNDQDMYMAAEIMNSGLVIKGTCSRPGLPKPNLTFDPKPGEIYLLAVHLNLWEWIRYCAYRTGGCD